MQTNLSASSTARKKRNDLLGELLCIRIDWVLESKVKTRPC
jgi:hypothetical protein